VCSIPVEVPAAARARWLAELAEALDQAKRLLIRPELGAGQRATTAELLERVEATRAEVEMLRINRQPQANPDPQWINLAPWENRDRGSG
jgi:hypothetical protein